MIPPHSSSVNGAVLKIRKIVPRLDFSSRAISARSFPAAYSSMTRMCRREIRPRFAFTLFRRRAFATGDIIDLITLNATSPSYSASLRRTTWNDASHNSIQYRHCGSCTSHLNASVFEAAIRRVGAGSLSLLTAVHHARFEGSEQSRGDFR
jgi:hypothetical protein